MGSLPEFYSDPIIFATYPSPNPIFCSEFVQGRGRWAVYYNLILIEARLLAAGRKNEKSSAYSREIREIPITNIFS